MKEEGFLFIESIEREQTSELLHSLLGGAVKEGLKENHINFIIGGKGYILDEFMNLMSQRGANLYSTHETMYSEYNTRKIKIELTRVTKWSLALF